MSDITTPLLQRHVETFMRELQAHGIDAVNPLSDKPLAEQIQVIGAVTRAAAEAGMLNGTNPDELEPWRAARLSAEVLNAVYEALIPPKGSSSPQPNMPTDEENAPKS